MLTHSVSIGCTPRTLPHRHPAASETSSDNLYNYTPFTAAAAPGGTAGTTSALQHFLPFTREEFLRVSASTRGALYGPAVIDPSVVLRYLIPQHRKLSYWPAWNPAI